MNHKDINELLSAFSNGELAATQREFVEEHLATCAECAAQLTRFNSIRQEITSLRSLLVPESIKEETMAQITAPSSSRSSSTLFRPALAALVLLLALSIPIGILFNNGESISAVANAYAATNNLVSFSMAGTTVSEFQGRTNEASFAWDIADEDRVQGSLSSDGTLIEFVIDGDTQYAKGAPPGLVVSITDQSIFVSPVPTRKAALELLDTLGEIEQLPDASLDGVNHLRRRGDVDMDKLIDSLIAEYDESLPGPKDFSGLESQRSAEISVDLWIAPDTFFINRLVLELRTPATINHGDGTTTVEFMHTSTDVRYTRHNEPFTLELPLDNTGALLPGWAMASDDGAPDPVVNLQVVGD